jgi:predicted AlkP superfamily pyrophosphatase or phosphodiesterase
MPKVLYISTDGLRPDAIEKAHTPNLQWMMKQGAYTLSAQAMMPSVTLPCHMSIFHSVPPERHGILSNTYVPMVRPVKGLVETLYGAGKRCAFFYSWENLRDLSPVGCLELSKFIAYRGNPQEADDLTIEKTLPYLQANSFDFSFLYFATIDEVGHDHGWMSRQYLQQVEHVDRLLGNVFEVLSEDVVTILHSDHGGHDRSHGTDALEDITIPWMMMGKGIKQNYEMAETISLLDTAPTIAHVLGVPIPKPWEGQIVKEAFI